MEISERSIQEFWNANPCGQEHVAAQFADNYTRFFDDYDAFRYRLEKHIPATLDGIHWQGKRVLEIGLGQGADAEQIIRRGARWSGLDLTAEAVKRVGTRMQVRSLPFDEIRQGSILNPPYASGSFDVVFSHGVLHHIPDIRTASQQIHKLLRRDGELIIMMYATWSLNHLLMNGVLKRLLLLGLYATNYHGRREHWRTHVELARQAGLWRHLRMKNFIHSNTDGVLNPYTKMYDVRTVRKDFAEFDVVRSYKRYLCAPPLPVGWLPLGGLLGWHLWVHLKPR